MSVQEAFHTTKPVACIRGVTLQYGVVKALDNVDLDIPAGCTVGMIGPDGVGKSSLLSLIAGAREIQSGKIELFGGDMSDVRHREMACPKIAFMPQGLGKNLYHTLSVAENIDFFGRIFGLEKEERKLRSGQLMEATGLFPFSERPAGKLSGGMKQKLGLCCALIHEPDILILDEPTTGIDPLSRRLFWELVDKIQKEHKGMSVLVATAYMEEAARFDWLIAMNDGHVLFTGTGEDFLKKKDATSMEEAFITMLPEEQLKNYKPVVIPPRDTDSKKMPEISIEAENLTMRFGDFTAVDHVSFKIERGEIFGFLGSNGCGKTTTMKMLTGLLPPTEGEAKLFGHILNPNDIETRKHVGYMSQSFSLYTELTVKQNLILHARLFGIPENKIPEKIQQSINRFGLENELNSLPESIPFGQRQRLSLAVAMIHSPEVLILDEPTSGVDPIMRDAFWQNMIDLSRNDKVTIFISTHFMNEASRCDRISLMHQGKVLASGSPAELVRKRQAKSLEEAFIQYLEDAGALIMGAKSEGQISVSSTTVPIKKTAEKGAKFFSLQRMFSFLQRESLELYRDPARLLLSIFGSLVLMLAFGYGITLDIENLAFAVLDRDQTNISRDYIYNIAGSRYFTEHSPLKDYEDLNQRMQSGEIGLAIEIPPNFARDIRHNRNVSIGTWVDGAMPRRGEIIRGYVLGMNLNWLNNAAKKWLEIKAPEPPISIEPRYLYNPDVKSIRAMVPAAIAILLMVIPAVLSSLSVVREKELGSIMNLYVSPATRLEFLIGKQIPYVVVGLINFILMVGLAITIFDVPVKGSFLTLLVGTTLFIIASTSIGIFVSSFTKSQTAAIFGTCIITILPSINFSGLLDPITSLEGLGSFVGYIFPTSYYLIITRGVFSKGLGFEDLSFWFIPLLVAIPVLLALCTIFLRKQER